jgi:3-methyladenine DNA glycosylase/8-oxoguanine DNA glycosylase
MPLLLDPEVAVPHLRRADPVLARIIEAAGPFEMREDAGNPFRALSRSIIFQQLSGKAAGTIYNRFVALFGDDVSGGALLTRSDPDWTSGETAFPEPPVVLALSDESMRTAGLSRQKIASLRSLAEHFDSGELGLESFEHWEDEEIIAHLTRVRGIGRWTAEMFLMFHLRRPDVLPVNDVGINRAIQRQYQLDQTPAPAEVLRIGEPWRPWATVACWYLWRSEDVQLMTGSKDQ